MPSVRQDLGRAITWRYLLALGLIAVLSAGTFIILYHTVDQEEKRASIVRSVANQEVLTQRIAFLATAFASSTSVEDQETHRLELERATHQLRRILDAMAREEAPWDNDSEIAARVRSLFFDGAAPFARQIQRFLGAAEQIAASDPGELHLRHPLVLRVDLAGMNHLPQEYHLIADILESDGLEIHRYIKNIEISIFSATILLLILEAFTIFRPLVRDVQDNVERMVLAEKTALAVRAEAEQSRRRLFESIDTLDDGFALYNEQDRIVLANRAFRNMHRSIEDQIDQGASFEELLRVGLERGMWDIGDEDAEAWIEAQVAPRRDLTRYETEVRFADGRHMLRREQRTETGETVGLRIDVTQDRKREERLQHYAEDMKRFAYIASHDLQEPLRKIASHVSLLKEAMTAKDQEEIDRCLAVLRKSAHRGRGIITDLLRYSRMQNRPVERENVDLIEVLDEITQQLPDPGEGGTYRISSDLRPLTARCDRGLITQVLQNLIGNALKYRKPDEPARIHVSIGYGASGESTITIRDEGIGFDPKQTSRLFEPFRRLVTKDSYEGNGIGLSLVAAILEKHGWAIEAKGQPGTGATFSVHIPATDVISGRTGTTPDPAPLAA